MDWPAQLAVVRASGYDGPIGLEYFPAVEVGGVDRVHPVGRRGRVTDRPAGGAKIDVLLATGRVTVEHDNEFRSFRHHTSMLTALLKSTGRFRVRVLEDAAAWRRAARPVRRRPGHVRGPRRLPLGRRGPRDDDRAGAAPVRPRPGEGDRLVPRLVGAGARLGLGRGVRPDARCLAQPRDGTPPPAAGRGRGPDDGPAPPDHRRPRGGVGGRQRRRPDRCADGPVGTGAADRVRRRRQLPPGPAGRTRTPRWSCRPVGSRS